MNIWNEEKDELNWSLLTESQIDKHEICEMANYRKRLSGLPVNIWLDECETYKKGRHAPRIKFQLDTNDKMTNNFASMTFDGVIRTEIKNCEISSKDIDKVRNFVLNNKYALQMIADGYLFIDEFIMIQIRGGNKATDEQIESLKLDVDDIIKDR